jgi:hypothetical protein
MYAILNDSDSDSDADIDEPPRKSTKTFALAQAHRIRVYSAVMLMNRLAFEHQMFIIKTVKDLTPTSRYHNRFGLPKKEKSGNEHRDRPRVIAFIRGMSGAMFERQYRISREDFWDIHRAVMDKKVLDGYDEAKHLKYATISSGSPVTLELRMYITFRILSGASYLDMIWYAVEVNSVHNIVWRTCCEIDSAVHNIDFPITEVGMQRMADNWAIKREERHGFATNQGTLIAVDGIVPEIRQPKRSELDGQDVRHYMNRKGFWALVCQVGCDVNGKVRMVATDWPGATNDVVAFRETALYRMLRDKQVPDHFHIIGDEAYSALAAECNDQFLTPFSNNQLQSAKARDVEALHLWNERKRLEPDYNAPRPP